MACNTCVVWILKREKRRKLLALGTDYLRRSARVTRLEKISTATIWSKMHAELRVLDVIKNGNTNDIQTSLLYKYNFYLFDRTFFSRFLFQNIAKYNHSSY
jgi:hypothetical protein